MAESGFFGEIFQRSPYPTVILSGQFPHIVVREANSAYLELTNRSREYLIDKPFLVTTSHPSMNMDAQGFVDVRESIAKVFREKKVVKTPVQRFYKTVPEGEEPELVYLEATNTPVLNTKGEIDFIIRTLQNVTDIVVAAEKDRDRDRELIDKERFLSATQKAARIGSWEMNTDGRVIWSDILYDIMEVEPGTVITIDFVLTLLKGEKDRELLSEIYEMAITSGEHFHVELGLITPKGNERWIRFMGMGEIKDGKFVRMYGLGQDVTVQHQTREELINSRNQLGTIIQTVEGVVFEASAATLELEFVSEQIKDLLGYSPEECIRQPDFLSRILHPDDLRDLPAQLLKRIPSQKNFTGDYRVLRKDGTMRWMKISVAVIREDGEPQWLRGMMMDITTSKLNMELERVEKYVLEINTHPWVTTDQVLRTYLQGIESIFPGMRCSIMKVKNGRLHHWIGISLPSEYVAAIQNIRIGDNSGSCGTAAYRNERVIVADVATDPLWHHFKDIALEHNLRSCWSQPLRNASAEVVATLGMYYETIRAPTEEELKVIDRTVYLLQVILQERHNYELLREANLLMEQSQELAHFGSVQYNIATEEVTWSKELYRIFGIRETVKPTIELYYDALHPDDRDRIKGVIEKFIETQQDYITEERIIRPDGEVRTLRTWGRAVLDENGEVQTVVSAYLDITDNKKIQEDLLASEYRLRSLVDSQTNYVIRIDFDEKYSYANGKYMENFGPLNGESIIGTNALQQVVAEHQQRVDEVCKKCIDHPNQVFEVELEKHDNKGNIRYTFWHFVCLTDSQGQPKEIQCIGVDVSDIRKAEAEREQKAAELERSEKRYSDLFHLSPQPMWVYDAETLHFLDVNRAAVEQYGYTRSEFLRMTVDQLRSSVQILVPEEVTEGWEKNDISFHEIVTHVTKSGEQIQVDQKQNSIPFKGRKAELVLAINITKPLQYLDTLEKQNARLADIAWIQSHLVRAPLSRIMGLAALLKNGDSDDEEKRFILENVATSAAELDQMIRDIVRKAEQINPTGEKPLK